MPDTDSNQNPSTGKMILPIHQEAMASALQPEAPLDEWLGPQAFEDLFEASGIGKAILNEQGQVKTSNRSLSEMLGYAAAELSGQALSDWLGPEDQSMMNQICAQLVKGQLDAYQTEKSLLPKAGQSLRARVHLVRLFEPVSGEISLLLELQDVTRQHQEELAYQAEHERLRMAEKMAKILYSDLDLGTGLGIWSSDVFELFGVDPEHFVPTLAAAMPLFHPDDVEAILKGLDIVIKTDQNQSVRYRINRPDGSQVTVLMLMEKQYFFDGQSPHVLATLIDITPYLAPHLEEANRKLADQIQQVKQLIELTDDQLTSPLANLQAVSDAGSLAGLGEASRHSIEALGELSQNLQDARKPSYEQMPVSLEHSAQKALQMLVSEQTGRQVQISLDFSAWNWIEYIPFYLEQLLYQLLSQTLKLSSPHLPLQIRLSNSFDEAARHLLIYEVTGVDLSPYFAPQDSTLGHLKVFFEGQGSQLACQSTQAASCRCRIRL